MQPALPFRALAFHFLVADERAGAVLTKGRIRAIAGWTEDDVFDERLERSRQARNVSFTVGGK